MFPIKHSRRTTGTCVTMLPRTRFFLFVKKKPILIIRRPEYVGDKSRDFGRENREKMSLHSCTANACESITVVLNTPVPFLFFTSIFPSFSLQNTTFDRVNGTPLWSYGLVVGPQWRLGLFDWVLKLPQRKSIEYLEPQPPTNLETVVARSFCRVRRVISKKSLGEIAPMTIEKKNIKLLKTNIITTQYGV